MNPSWIDLRRGDAPVVISMPHTGTLIPDDIAPDFVSPWLARKDTDWWVERLYDFARDADITVVRTAIARAVIDANRDPSGASLYPGLATTELCPTTTFDGEALYHEGRAPGADEIARRREAYFDPYHAILAAELARLRRHHPHVVLYEAHSIRSRIPRLFADALPHFNIGTNDGATCDPALTTAVRAACGVQPFTAVVNGRFKGGWTTRAYGRPSRGLHAIQMELAMRGYLDEPAGPVAPANWPQAYDPARAAPMREVLRTVLAAILAFAVASPRQVEDLGSTI